MEGKLEKVQAPQVVLNGLEAAAAVDLCMAEISQGQLIVIRWFDTTGFPEAAQWASDNFDLFCKGLVVGFEAQGDASCLRKLSDYTDAEKCAKFDELYRMAIENFVHACEHGYGEKDIKHWMFEAVMGLLGEQEMWDAYNANMR